MLLVFVAYWFLIMEILIVVNLFFGYLLAIFTIRPTECAFGCQAQSSFAANNIVHSTKLVKLVDKKGLDRDN